MSKQINRDYQFYLDNADHFTFSPYNLPDVEFSPYGLSAEEAFIQFDTHGKLYPCRDRATFLKALRCKRAINFQLKQWGEGYNDMGMGVQDYMHEFIHPPAWVEKALRRQIALHEPSPMLKRAMEQTCR